MKGVLYTWLIVLVTIVTVGIVYTIMYELTYGHIFPLFDPLYAAIGNEDVTSAYEGIKSYILYFPAILIFGLLLYAFARSLKREPDTYQSGYT